MPNKEYLKSYYEKNREHLLQKQKEKYEKNKEAYKEEYKLTYYDCECGKRVSTLRKHFHDQTRYHTSRIHQ